MAVRLTVLVWSEDELEIPHALCYHDGTDLRRVDVGVSDPFRRPVPGGFAHRIAQQAIREAAEDVSIAPRDRLGESLRELSHRRSLPRPAETLEADDLAVSLGVSVGRHCANDFVANVLRGLSHDANLLGRIHVPIGGQDALVDGVRDAIPELLPVEAIALHEGIPLHDAELVEAGMVSEEVDDSGGCLVVLLAQCFNRNSFCAAHSVCSLVHSNRGIYKMGV